MMLLLSRRDVLKLGVVLPVPRLVAGWHSAIEQATGPRLAALGDSMTAIGAAFGDRGFTLARVTLNNLRDAVEPFDFYTEQVVPDGVEQVRLWVEVQGGPAEDESARYPL